MGRAMGEVFLTLNGRSYQLACRDGEERRLEELARYVEQKFDNLAAEFGQIGKLRLLMMSALMIADELFDARTEGEETDKIRRSS